MIVEQEITWESLKQEFGKELAAWEVMQLMIAAIKDRAILANRYVGDQDDEGEVNLTIIIDDEGDFVMIEDPTYPHVRPYFLEVRDA